MSSEENLDTELLQGLVTDLGGTFPHLVATYHSQLQGFVCHQGISSEDAEDIMQDSWVRIYQALDRYPKEQKLSLHLRAWLYTIVRNQALTHHKDKKKRMNFISIEDLYDAAIEDYAQDLEDIVAFKSRMEEVCLILEELPPQYCLILKLYIFEDLGYQEIATQLNKSVGNIRTVVSRGKKLLREKLTANVP
jgi:RNA polymerase sigma-70 factor (ECF subfamily)